jgi:hypothetical protein
MKSQIFYRFLCVIVLACVAKIVPAQNATIHLFPDTLSASEIKTVVKDVENNSRNYDSVVHLIKAKAFKHYHSDLDETYTVHNVLNSFNYAVALFDAQQPAYTQRNARQQRKANRKLARRYRPVAAEVPAHAHILNGRGLKNGALHGSCCMCKWPICRPVSSGQTL